MVKYRSLNLNGHDEKDVSVDGAKDAVKKDLQEGKLVAQKKEGDKDAKVVRSEKEIDSKTKEVTAVKPAMKG